MINKGLLEETFGKEVVSDVKNTIALIWNNRDYYSNNLFFNNIRTIDALDNDFYIWFIRYINKQVENEKEEIINLIKEKNDCYSKCFSSYDDIQKQKIENGMKILAHLANEIEYKLKELENGYVSDNLLILHFNTLKNNLDTEIKKINSIELGI